MYSVDLVVENNPDEVQLFLKEMKDPKVGGQRLEEHFKSSVRLSLPRSAGTSNAIFNRPTLPLSYYPIEVE